MKNKLSEHCGCPIKEKMNPLLMEYIGTTRALQLWFQAAHHATRGASFLGDHIHLYGRIYEQIQEDIDMVIEKAICILEDESVSCPKESTRLALEILEGYPSPSQHTSLSIAANGKMLMTAYLKLIESFYKQITELDAMTLGLEDHISSTCNQYENFVYLLQQREKSELEN